MRGTIEKRLRKLEAERPSGGRTFIFGELEAGDAKRRELIAEGAASEDDLFIFTGVPQADPGSYTMYDFDFAQGSPKRV
jgi:hypothetical protein